MLKLADEQRRRASRSAASASPSRRAMAPRSRLRGVRDERARAGRALPLATSHLGPTVAGDSCRRSALARDPVAFLDRCRDALRRRGDDRPPRLRAARSGSPIPRSSSSVLASPEEMSGGEANRVTEPIIGPQFDRSTATGPCAPRPAAPGRASPASAVTSSATGRSSPPPPSGRCWTWEEGAELALHPGDRADLHGGDPDAPSSDVRERPAGWRSALAVADLAAMGNLAAARPRSPPRRGPGRARAAGSGGGGSGSTRSSTRRSAGPASRHDSRSRGHPRDPRRHPVRGWSSPLPDDEIRDELVGLIVAGQESTGRGACLGLRPPPPSPGRARRSDRRRRGSARQASPTRRSRSLCGCVHRSWPAGRIAMRGRRARPLAPARRDTALGPDDPRSSEAARTTRSPIASGPSAFLGHKPRPMTWIPFGAGTRRCIGMSFALLEMRTILQTVLSRALTCRSSRRTREAAAEQRGDGARRGHARPIRRAQTGCRIIVWAERVVRSRDVPLRGSPSGSGRPACLLLSDRARSASRQPPRDRTGSPS